MPALENAAIAVIDHRKFANYCLDPQSRHGRHKAKLFKAALGFDQSNHQVLIAAIRKAILKADALYQGETAHGHRWRVDLAVTGPAGSAMIRTAWIYEKGDHVPRLTTAYVLRKER